MASQVAVARTNYIAWENGLKPPSAASLTKLSAALSVAPEDLTSTGRADATLRDLREWAGLTQAAVAEHLGFAHSSAWAGIESGATRLAERHRRVLAGLFGSSEDELAAAWDRSSTSGAEVEGEN